MRYTVYVCNMQSLVNEFMCTALCEAPAPGLAPVFLGELDAKRDRARYPIHTVADLCANQVHTLQLS